MNQKNRSTSFYRLRALPVATAIALFVSASAYAQLRTPIGLSSKDAQLWLEEGSYPHNPGGGDLFGTAVAVGDFNNDGYDELAVGAPKNDCDPQVLRCGAVQVRTAGVAALTSRFVLSPTDNALDIARAEELYGRALAAGDFNGDGLDDLAVGIPQNFVRFGSISLQAGAVQLHLGQPIGFQPLQTVAEYSFSQASDAGLPGSPNPFEQFGHAVAMGDFNGDGKDDIAAGIPFDRHVCGGSPCSGGSVMVIGLDDQGAPGGYLMALGRDGLPGRPDDQDQYGWAVATGDFNNDGFDDLATGIPNRNGAGAVLVVYGSPFSLIFGNHQYIDETSFGDAAEPGDRFGASLATGDFNNDGYADLAIGTPDEDQGGVSAANSGVVSVVYGTTDGLVPKLGTRFSQEDFSQVSEIQDRFGSAVIAGDFDADGYDDLAIGAAGETNVIGGPGSGAVTVLRGGFSGLRFQPHRQLRPHEFPAGLVAQRPNESDEGAGFGEALAVGDFDNNGYDDLVIGAPGRWFGASLEVGAVGVVYGRFFMDDFETGDVFEWSAVTP